MEDRPTFVCQPSVQATVGLEVCFEGKQRNNVLVKNARKLAAARLSRFEIVHLFRITVDE